MKSTLVYMYSYNSSLAERKKSSSGSQKPSKTSSVSSKKAKRAESSDDEDGNVSFDENEEVRMIEIIMFSLFIVLLCLY